VIPLQFLGVTDPDFSNVSTNELMTYALCNLDNSQDRNEGGYAVRHSRRPVPDFGQSLPGQKEHRNPLMAAYPLLWPYGEGGIESDREIKVSFNDHV
jgi:hypothetical protein